MPSAFQIEKDGKILNYRDGEKLDEAALRNFFEKKGYIIITCEQQSRHVILHLTKMDEHFCAKVSCSEGISVLTTREIKWNKKGLQYLPTDAVFTVPHVIEDGIFSEKYVFYVTEWIETHFLAVCPPAHTVVPVVSFSPDLINKCVVMTKQIQELSIDLPLLDESAKDKTHTDIFVGKTRQWIEQVPQTIPDHVYLEKLFDLVTQGAESLEQVVRHGDVTPWHIQLQPNGKLLLFDGEHAHSQGVEGYDIAYFIQRVYSVLQSKKLAREIFDAAVAKGYDLRKLQNVLAARGIGGFCDESLLSEADYAIHIEFAQWILSL